MCMVFQESILWCPLSFLEVNVKHRKAIAKNKVSHLYTISLVVSKILPTMAQSDKLSICKSVIEWLCTHNNSNYNVHSQLYVHVLQFHGNQHTINNNTLHSLMMVHYQWIIHYTQY